MITDHKYDSGPDGPGGPCLYAQDTSRPFSGSAMCGKHEEQHAESEYEDFSGEAKADAWQARQDMEWLAQYGEEEDQ